MVTTVGDAAWTADLEAAMQHGGGDAAWRLLTLRESEVSKPIVWHAYLEVARRYPAGAKLETLRAIEGAMRHQGMTSKGAIALAQSYNALAGAVAPDAPVQSDSPAQDALRVCDLAIDDANSQADQGALHIARGNALRALGPERDKAMLEAYQKGLALDPRAGAHLDLAIAHKQRGRWEPCLEALLEARKVIEDDDPSLRSLVWNTAIAATATARGELAKACWEALGMENVRVSQGGLAIVEGIPPRFVRVRSRPSGLGADVELPGASRLEENGYEVLQVIPRSPCHGIVVTPSFDEAPLDYGDIVLFDGAPVSSVELDDERTYPVFVALERLRQGDERRLRFVAISSPNGITELQQALSDNDESARVFVQASGPQKDEQLVYGKVIVGPDVSLEALVSRLEAYGKSTAGFRLAVPELYELAGQSKRAGQEHQAWRGIERAAVKRDLAAFAGKTGERTS